MFDYFNPQVLQGMRDELRKIAISLPALTKGFSNIGGAIQRGAGAVGTGAGMGGLGGGLIGAGIGGAQKYLQAKREGQDTGGALVSGMSGAAHGALTGGLTGAALGAAGGGVAHALGKVSPEMLARARNVPVLGSGARYGQAQAHSFTGWTPQSGMRGLGIGADSAIQGAEAARNRARELYTGTAPELHTVGAKLRRAISGEELGSDAAKRFRAASADKKKAMNVAATAMEAERRGFTNIPGYLSNPLAAFGTSVKQRWQGSGPVEKALMFGLPTAMAAKEVARDDPSSSRLSRAAKGAAMIGGATAFAPMSMTADMLLGTGLTKAVDKATGAFDRRILHKGVARPDTGGRSPGLDVEEHNIGGPVERVETARFRGEAPQGGMA